MINKDWISILFTIILGCLIGLSVAMAKTVALAITGGLVIFVALVVFGKLYKNLTIGWIVYGILLSLWAFDEFRVEAGIFKLDLSTMFVMLMYVLFFFQITTQPFKKYYNENGMYMLLATIFVIDGIFKTFMIYLYQLDPSYGFKSSIKLLFCISIMFLANLTIDKKNVKKIIMWVVFASTAVFGLSIILSIILKKPVINGFLLTNGPSISTGKNQVAVVLSVVTPLGINYWMSLKRGQKMLFVYIPIILGLATIMSNSRIAWVSVAVSSVVMFLVRKNKLKQILTYGLILFLALSILLYAMPDKLGRIIDRYNAFKNLSDTSISTRIYYSQFAFDTFMKYPLLGAGTGYFMNTLAETPHNDYFWILGERGFFIFLIFIYLLLRLLLNLYYVILNKMKKYDERYIWEYIAVLCSLVSVLILLTQNDSHEATPVWFLFSLALVLIRHSDENTENSLGS